MFLHHDNPSAHDLELQSTLSAWNRRRLTPTHAPCDWLEEAQEDLRMRMLEGRFLEHELASVSSFAANAPREASELVSWFRALEQHGPGQNDVLFPWLAERASSTGMKWFLRQELAGEAGFDDLVALTQIKLPTRAKLELARNYWDEMGRGMESGMHGLLLERLAEALEIEPASHDAVPESIALGNLMIALATQRHYAYQSIGALGVIELTAPGRAACVNAGLKRLGIGGQARRYYALHATLDRKHADSWCSEVLLPLVSADPNAATAIAEGALLRLQAGARCFERYRRELGLHDLHPDGQGRYPSRANLARPVATNDAPMSVR